MNGPFQDALDMCTLFSSLCPQVGLAGGLRSSVYDFERYSTTPKPCLTSLPVCKSFLSCQCFLTKSKEDTSSKGSSRYFQKHEVKGGAGVLQPCLLSALIWFRVLPCGVVRGTLRKGRYLS